jgi:transcriptional regulator with XRE-family HTH domain
MRAITSRVIARLCSPEEKGDMQTTSVDRRSATAGFGTVLREWRRMRGISQLDLSLTCGLSQRHLSFLESGRSRPSRGMVLHLASALNLPLQQQNAMLLSAGFAPVFKERPMDAPEMKPVELALSHALRQQEPYPALVVDQAHNIQRINRPLGLLLGFLSGMDDAALMSRGPINAIEIMLNPDGLRSVVENWAEIAVWSVRRLRAEATLEGADGEAAKLLRRVLMLPDVPEAVRASQDNPDLPPTLAVRLQKDGTRLALFSMIATIGTPLDVSLQNLRLELLYPADEATTRWFSERAHA